MTLEERIVRLEAIIRQGDFSSSKVFDEKIISRNQIIAEGNGINITSNSNPIGCTIVTGNKTSDATIKAEIGSAIPNGSIYLSTSTTNPVFINLNGTWTALAIP